MPLTTKMRQYLLSESHRVLFQALDILRLGRDWRQPPRDTDFHYCMPEAARRTPPRCCLRHFRGFEIYAAARKRKPDAHWPLPPCRFAARQLFAAIEGFSSGCRVMAEMRLPRYATPGARRQSTIFCVLCQHVTATHAGYQAPAPPRRAAAAFISNFSTR